MTQPPLSPALRRLAIVAGIVLSLVALTACGNQAEKLNNTGNQAYAEQAFDEALAAYQQAQFANPELAEPYYNTANVLYRQGDYAGALEALQKALALADDPTKIALAESGFFNLGNNYFNNQELDPAIDAYTQALLRNPGDLDAKHNLELALQQQQEQQEQNQEQDPSQESESEQDQENQDPQDQSQNGEDQNQSENQDPSQAQQEPSDQQEPSEQQDGQSQEEQQAERQPQDPQDPGNQDQSQPQQGEPQDSQQPNYTPAPGQRLSEEQAKQLLAAIAQGSDTLQERLGMMLVVPNRPPVQDW